MSLAETWGFAGDPDDAGIGERWFSRTLDDDTIILPGTTDDKGYGTPHGLKPELTREVLRILARKHGYIGPAWYQKTVTIPQPWENKAIFLNLERVIWETRVWVNEQPAGMADSVIAPYVYDLTDLLSPGTHRSTIRIDNSKKCKVGNMAHAHSHETQIMWNGVIGDISLRAIDSMHIDDVQVYADVAAQSARAALTINNPTGQSEAAVTLTAKAVNGEPHRPPVVHKNLTLPAGQTTVV